jgi:prolycopene isomerase
MDEARAVYHDIRRVSADQHVGRAPELTELPLRYPHLSAVSGETWEQLLARHVNNVAVRAILASLWSYLCLPPSRLSALLGAALLGYYDHGGWYPRGGSQALSRALEAVLRERGGEIRYTQTVTGICLEHGRAIGVRTAEGLAISADVIVSNASAPTTMFDLVGRQHLPAEYAARVTMPARSYSAVSVYLGLSRDVFAEQSLPHELFVFPSYDHDAGYTASIIGDWARAPLMITDYTGVDPGCAPPGWGVVVVSTGASWDYEDVWGTGGDLTDYHQCSRYLELKDRVSDVLVARAEEQVPGLLAAIRHRETSTPLTNFLYTQNPSGAIEGYENTVDNTGPGWLPQSTPIANLFLAGAWTNSGGQMPALQSGIAAGHLAATITTVCAS